ncbi:MAG: hypothetical protein SFV15_23525 [Polyangiaceae bacterium]|nr:hypothetical protein [Polyangiaceae bacterium]
MIHKKLDAGKFELPKGGHTGDHHVEVSDAMFNVIFSEVTQSRPALAACTEPAE